MNASWIYSRDFLRDGIHPLSRYLPGVSSFVHRSGGQEGQVRPGSPPSICIRRWNCSIGNSMKTHIFRTRKVSPVVSLNTESSLRIVYRSDKGTCNFPLPFRIYSKRFELSVRPTRALRRLSLCLSPPTPSLFPSSSDSLRCVVVRVFGRNAREGRRRVRSKVGKRVVVVNRYTLS